MNFREAKRLANLGTIVGTAAEQLGDAEVPDEDPDHDWTARFFDYAQDVSTQEMQTLWAKVLAGEVERPGSTSLQTLSFLRNLDRDAAQLFAKLCSLSLSFVIDGTEILDGRVVSLKGNAAENSLAEYGLSFGELNRLQEHGLIISDYNSWRDYSSFPRALHTLKQANPEAPIQALVLSLRNSLTISYAGSLWFLRHVRDESPAGEIRINGVAMSSAGKELSRIVVPVPNPAYSTALASFLLRKQLTLTRLEDLVVLK